MTSEKQQGSKVPPNHGYIDFVGDKEHYWRIETLWQAVADLPVQEVDLDRIGWQQDGCHNLSHPPLWGELASHCKRAMVADLFYPVIVDRDWQVIDGMHRIIKAYVTGQNTIRAVQLPDMPKPDRMRNR